MLKARRLPPGAVTHDARGVWRNPSICRKPFETSRRMRFCHKAAPVRYVACVGGRVIDAVTLGHATQRELATIPAKRAMRTRSESEDARIFVIKLAR